MTSAAYSRSCDAQRRPGLSPRRHPGRARRTRTAPPPRSTKAGALTPATRTPPGRRTRKTDKALNEGRGSHPGDTSPLGGPRRSGRASLNEGRGSHPGDTTYRHLALRPVAPRSTKAGALTPATHKQLGRTTREYQRAQRRPGLSPRRHVQPPEPRCHGPSPLNEGRGSHPGDTHRTAEPQHGLPGGRSTKAGALTPATHQGRPFMPSYPLQPLNEGRGSHPGDT